MKFKTLKAALAVSALLLSSGAAAEFGVGVKAGTLGLGVEGRWDPVVPWFDVRLGFNTYDYSKSGDKAGIGYDGTLALDNYFLTGNIEFPLSPFRLTVGAFSNGNELHLSSQATESGTIEIGGIPFDSGTVGTLRSNTSFTDSAPYAGIGFDFELFGKAGLNLDIGVLWQDEPTVTLEADNWEDFSPVEQALLGAALEVERAELEDDLSDLKAWPVISLAFVYNF